MTSAAILDRRVLLGATGDLAGRYMFPALATLLEARRVPETFVVVGAARHDFDDDEFRRLVAVRQPERGRLSRNRTQAQRRDGRVPDRPIRNLVALGDADPVDAAPLADAGLTPYHAINLALPRLAGGGKHALVIGLGGLGLVTVQILRAITGAQVIATDLKSFFTNPYEATQLLRGNHRGAARRC